MPEESLYSLHYLSDKLQLHSQVSAAAGQAHSTGYQGESSPYDVNGQGAAS
jgi:hypothetical protein